MKAFVLLGMLAWWGLAPALARAEPASFLRSRAPGHASTLLLLEVSELDAEDSARLQELLNRELRVVRLPDAASDAVQAARRSAASEVLILDRAHQRVSLVRAGDPEVWTRSTNSDALSDSAYAVSFVAAELLTLSAQRSEQRAREFGLLRLWLRGGADVVWGGSPYQESWRPAVALGGLWARPEHAFGFTLELAAALLGKASQRSELGQVALSHHDLALRAGAAYQRARLSLLGFGQAGLRFTSAEYSGPGGASVHHSAGTLGAGLQTQVELLPWLFVFAEGLAGANLARADFVVQGESVAREGPWFGRAGLGLLLALPGR